MLEFLEPLCRKSWTLQWLHRRGPLDQMYIGPGAIRAGKLG